MPHDHSHHHLDAEAGDRKVALAVGVNLLLTVAQIAGGILSGSVALIADAIHNLSDAMSLVIAFAARRIARRPADPAMTFGYGRAEVVAALVNYTSLILIALYLGYEAVARLFSPEPVEGWIVVILAAVALAVDLVTVLLTMRMAKSSVNIRAAFLHNLADAASSVVVIVAGTLIILYDWRLVDPIATLAIATYILWHAGTEIVPVIRILMLGSPTDMKNDEVQAAMAGVEGVEDVHHLHLWQIDEHRVSVEAHVVIAADRQAQFPRIARDIKNRLADRFDIRHSTLEMELPGACQDR
ncbi:cation diffusion facilitator family transporter [Tranquillimonas alkanivorans]|uniref:Cobalt-zinc-cadmium efflux system protein n=1 Tax=Tranquillimonas alkanivorans TaxID=441119 RepID=A0A1I5TA13_9RHOB|nr:cation diffusion facilitator family transporter [Tranquillimonas alkanivorans]SFP79862.1 cobalt-zinc-cadmium efflux system protein [Tranquillimonas alkanivorans]